MKRKAKKTYVQLKAKYPDIILPLRCGESYKGWDNDAERICKIMPSITLLQKKLFTTCDIQINQTDEILKKLVKAGYKVAICDPLEKSS